MEEVVLAEVADEQLDRILQAIQSKRWTLLEEIWNEVLSGEHPPIDFHRTVIDRLIRKQQIQHFNGMYERYLDKVLEAGDGEHALRIIEIILTENDQLELLRSRLLLAIEFAYEEQASDVLPEFLQRSGLKDEDVPLREAYNRFSDLLGATKGAVFIHNAWGVGVVRELDIHNDRVIIDFPLKKNQTMTLDGVRNYLRPVHREHILARMAVDPDGLKEKARKDPAEILKLALKSKGGRIKVADLKKILTTRFLTDAEYKSFWNASRKAIKVDPWIDQAGTGVHAELVLRKEPRSFFDDMIVRLGQAQSAEQRRDVLRDVRRHGDDAEMTAADREALYLLFAKPVEEGAISARSDLFQHGMLFLEFADLFEGKENPVKVAEFLAAGDVVELIGGLSIPDVRRLALERVMDVHPDDWAQIFAEVVLTLDTRTASWMEKTLAGAGKDHERQIALEAIFGKPDHNPDLFVWAAKSVIDGTWKHIAESLPATMICEELLSLLAELQEIVEGGTGDASNAARSAATKVRAVLSEGNCRYFKLALANSTKEEARRILTTVHLHDGLSNQLKRHLEDLLIDRHPDLRQTSRMEEDEERRKPSFHYTTREALDEQRIQLSRLLSQEIPQMAKVIEAARELGDLKENAEYHAAKDRQKLLMQQAAELEDLIARARIVDRKAAVPEKSGFGCRVSLHNTETGERFAYTLMGMWEADPQNNIISYLTPFGAQLVGRRSGEAFVATTQDGQILNLEVTGIELADEMREPVGN